MNRVDTEVIEGVAVEPIASETPTHRRGILETLDSIIVAFIMAFVFRAFVVEAFVIPTGSMAPTLYGAHGTIVCEQCGTEFAYGLTDPSTRSDGAIAEEDTAFCPNCNHANTNLRINDRLRNQESGDRILVLKWPWDLGIDALGPQRWDVTVFKDPSDGFTNFIKRLVGLPEEVLMVADGDVYTVPAGELSEATRTALEQQLRYKHEAVSGARWGGIPDLPAEVVQELDAKMRIARKTETAQKVLWFNLYDHDYPPIDPEEWQPRWTAGLAEQSGWNAAQRRVTFRDQGSADDYIELTGKPIRATYAYNINPSRGRYRHPDPESVSDLRVRFVLTPGGTEGAVAVRLEKHGRYFWGSVHADGTVEIAESDGAEGPMRTLASGKVRPLTPGRPVEVAVEHLDFRVAVYVDGQEVVATSDDPKSPAYYAPDLTKMRKQRVFRSEPPRVYAQGGDFELNHLLVQRDVHYYTHDARVNGNYRAWGTMHNPILLREDEFFMLGDNSAASKDSRLWDQIGEHLVDRGEGFQLGTVPRDQLIGKAFFVYWPSGLRVSWLPLLNRIGIIPDVGRMRWIR